MVQMGVIVGGIKEIFLSAGWTTQQSLTHTRHDHALRLRACDSPAPPTILFLVLMSAPFLSIDLPTYVNTHQDW